MVSKKRENTGSKIKGKGKCIATINLSKNTRITKSTKAGLHFPVSRIAKYMKEGRFGNRLGKGAPIYLTAVLEYLSAEILELAGNTAKNHNKNRVIPKYVQLAIKNDEELNKLMSNVTIASGGVVPNIHSELLPKKIKSLSAWVKTNDSEE